MWRYCKLCGECLLLDHYTERSRMNLPRLYNYRCSLCPGYALLLEGNEQVWEQIWIGNVRLIVFSQEHADNTTRRGLAFFQKSVSGWTDFENLYQFPLKELTHELAVQWANKLRTYLVFQ